MKFAQAQAGDSEIAVVILAAGESKRYGSPKQLADWFGEPLLLSVIKQVISCGYVPYVALGANKYEICSNPLLSSYVHRVINVENWVSGLSASIVASIEFLMSTPVTGVLFVLADQPLIGAKHLQNLLSLAKTRPENMLCTAYKQDLSEFGVPAYFPKATFAQLLNLNADQGAKWLLRKECATVVPIESSISMEESLWDIDEPEDLVRAKSVRLGLEQ